MTTERLIWGILALALVVRLPLLGGSFWLDEAAQALEVIRPLSQQLDIAFDFQPPLLHLWLHLWQYFGHQEWWLRWWGAVLPGLATIWFSYHWVRTITTSKVANWTALLLATSSFHLFYSQELRPYALPAAWAAAGWWLLVKWWQSSITGSNRYSDRRYQLGYAVVTIFGLYSSYLYAFIIPGQLLAGWLTTGRLWRRQWAAVALAGLAFVPWLPMLKEQLAASQAVRDSLPVWETVVSIPPAKALALIFSKFVFGVVDVEPSLFFVASSVGLLALVGWSHFWRNRHDLVSLGGRLVARWRGGAGQSGLSRQQHGWLVLVLAVALPILLAWLFSFAVPIVRPKRLLLVLPAFFGWLSWPLGYKSAGRAAAVVPAVLLVLNVLGLSQYWARPTLQRENWRQLHRLVSDRYPTSDSIVVFAFPDPLAPWQWYDRGAYQTVSSGRLNIGQVDNLRGRLEPIANSNYVITFDYLTDLTDPDRRLLREIEAFNFKEVEVIDQPVIGFTRVFAQPQRLLSTNQ